MHGMQTSRRWRIFDLQFPHSFRQRVELVRARHMNIHMQMRSAIPLMLSGAAEGWNPTNHSAAGPRGDERTVQLKYISSHGRPKNLVAHETENKEGDASATHLLTASSFFFVEEGTSPWRRHE